jgi:hypothetical protein
MLCAVKITGLMLGELNPLDGGAYERLGDAILLGKAWLKQENPLMVQNEIGTDVVGRFHPLISSLTWRSPSLAG